MADVIAARAVEIRLPTEAEWQLAAGGPWSWQYPWGTEYVDGSANLIDGPAGKQLEELANKRRWTEDKKVLWDDATSDLKRSTAVGGYPHAAAQCGAMGGRLPRT